MKVALFIPCYVDQFYPKVGIATLQLLEKLGVDVEFPLEQTCCGQPMANSGMEKASISTMQNFVDNFKGCDYIVGPTGSCVLHVKDHFTKLEQTPEVQQIRQNVYELCEFLHDVLKIDKLDARFPHKVGLHQSCHGHRGLRLAQASELQAPGFSKIRNLLKLVEDIELVELDRADECCGFGGTFAVSEEAVSVKMGKDRIADHERHGAEVITATDMSCLMHLEGLVNRQQKPIRIVHIAEILNGENY